ncbi:tetratricopeptide repeat protein [Fusobacterium russii]|uniref:tetratricopeptide repeat protein n=1 Tax=Fusobacterium russii TaxID=854 RepID=UPI0003A1682E|nr:tetratricopeptide repeat protein [Fusobacterium russii]
MKIKKIVGFILLMKTLTVFADDMDYFKRIDNLYKERNFSQALIESENYLQKYPNSKYYSSMLDKVGKIYFLNKNYEKTIEAFKKLYVNENKKSVRDEYAYYLTRAYASLGEKEKYQFYLQSIESKKIYNKTKYDLGIDLLSNNYNSEAVEIFSSIVNEKSENYDEALLNLGIAYYNEKKYEKSFKILDEYTRKNSDKNTIVIDYLKASSLYKNNKTDEAIIYFDKIVNTGLATGSDYGKKAILSLIEIYANKKNEEKVNYYLQKIQGTDTYNTAMIMIGDLYVTKEKYEEALVSYKKSSDLKNPRLIYGEAYSLYKLERYSEALKKFESLRNTDYYNQSIYHIFAINYKLKNFKQIIDSRDIIKNVVVTQTDTDNIIRIIANSAYQMGDYKLAKDYYGRLFAISAKKENLFRVILLDSQILDMEDLGNRFAQYKKLFSSDTEFKKDVYLYTGDAYFKSGNLERAEEIYKEYLDSYFNLEVLSSLMSTLLEQKKYDEMDRYLSLVNEEDKNSYLKGIGLIGLGRYEEAESYLQKAKNIATDSSLDNRIEVNRVRNFFLWKKYEEAISTGELFLNKIDKEREAAIYTELLDKIGLSYFRLGKYEEARKYYNKITEVKGYEVYGKYQIADSYYNQKDYETAKGQYKSIFENYDETFYGEQAYYRYISILKLQDKKDDFEREKDKFLEKYPESNLKNTVLNLSANYYSEINDTEKAIEALNEIKSSSDESESQDNNNTKIINLKLKNKDYKDIEKYISEIEDTEERAYYFSKYYAAKKDNKVVKEYESLLNSSKYKVYANKSLADYWYDKKDNAKAKKYYTALLKLDKNLEEDYMAYRLGLIYEKENNLKEALVNYKKIYDKYKGKYEIDSLVRAADIYDRQENNTEAKKLFFRLYKVKGNKELHEYTLEKLIYYRLLEENTTEAKKYFTELKKSNAKKAEKFEAYF